MSPGETTVALVTGGGRGIGATLTEGRLPFATGEVINVGGGLQLHRV